VSHRSLNIDAGLKTVHRSNIDGRMSELGHKQTSRHPQAMSALPPKADMGAASRLVRYVPKGDIRSAAKLLFDHLVGHGHQRPCNLVGVIRVARDFVQVGPHPVPEPC
jgi:hypothetical protein